MTRSTVEIRQIFYDAATRAAVRPGFLPLDNTAGRQDWFEFWPILQFLRTHPLDPDTWYGFVSPKFPDKTGMDWPRMQALLVASPDAEVALFSPFWTSLAVCQNPWLQGERDHPGLVAAMEGFLRRRGDTTRLADVVTDFDCSVNSNYFIARAAFWREWQLLAEAYLAHVEGAEAAELPDGRITSYDPREGVALKVFVQERLVNWVLLQRRFPVVRPDYEAEGPLATFYDRRWARWLYGRCDDAKRAAARGRGRALWLGVFHMLRLTIAVLQRRYNRTALGARSRR